MGIASKKIGTKDLPLFLQAWDYLNAQISDSKIDTKNIINFAVAKSRNGHLRVIDLGCGPAHLDFLLTQAGLSCIGIDNDRNMIEYARNLYPFLDLRNGDILTDEFENIGPFDVIICKHLDLPIDGLKTVLTKARSLLGSHDKGLLCFDFLVLDKSQKTKDAFTFAETINAADVKGTRLSRFNLEGDYYAWHVTYDLLTSKDHRLKVSKETRLYFITEEELSILLKSAKIEVHEKQCEDSGIIGLKGVNIYGTISKD